jgi:hypothetical protein
MASQMLVSVKGMSACTTPNEASASTTEASCGVSQQTRTCVRTPIGRYLRVGVRHRLNRTADLDGEVDAEPGLKIRALCIIALAELVERGCNEVIVTTFSPRRCDRIASAGIERRSRGGVALLAGTHRIPGPCVPRDFNPELDHPQLLARRQHHRGGDQAAVCERPGLSPHRGRAVDEVIYRGADPQPASPGLVHQHHGRSGGVVVLAAQRVLERRGQPGICVGRVAAARWRSVRTARYSAPGRPPARPHSRSPRPAGG